MRVILISIFILCISSYSDTYKLLVVFPIPGKSHSILGNAFVRHLLNAGHEVTYITPIPMKDVNSKLRQINVESNRNYFAAEEVLDIQKLMRKEVDMKDMPTVFTMMFNIANATIHHENVQKVIHNPAEKFDAVIAEWMYSELYSGFSAVFNCPLIFFLSVSPHNMALSLIDQIPNPAYTADHVKSNSIPPFTFWTRVQELLTLFDWKIYRWWVNDRNIKSYDEAFKSAVTKRGRTLPPLDEIKYNASLIFGNSHISTADGVPLPRNLVEIGGYHISSNVEALPKDLKKILDEAKHGFIFFSMGSMLQSSKMPEEIKTGLIKIFSQLKQTVIWKFEVSLPDKPKNIFIIDWAPQQSILAHPNCVLFITHGGLLSTTEALHYKVPIIGIPMFADQFININRAVAKGIAKRVDLNYNTPTNLKLAIEEILENSSYRDRVNELSFVYHDRVISPGAEITRWVDHVIKTKGAPHLRSPALLVPWYQKLYLDLVFLIIIVVSVFYISIKRLIMKNRRDVTLSKKRS
ncbi:PREDICTED: UDP-glucuronosyltransferase 2B1-like [Papilio polytes]|uniref:UDP-glucuronosyltransferase 2B1-like n=1 Tax=Papilio polytes TaxID=76194 RepID=UPI000676AA65|nr:PREDICTED: UDP-glucuronosyltransferase 2B1-like [Papilio polytes]